MFSFLSKILNVTVSFSGQIHFKYDSYNMLIISLFAKTMIANGKAGYCNHLGIKRLRLVASATQHV